MTDLKTKDISVADKTRLPLDNNNVINKYITMKKLKTTVLNTLKKANKLLTELADGAAFAIRN